MMCAPTMEIALIQLMQLEYTNPIHNKCKNQYIALYCALLCSLLVNTIVYYIE